MKVIISNIQRFCLHDGPGIRTTVFFKGCSLNCPWCSNPENIDFNIQKYTEDGMEKQFGYEISLEQLEEEILKDKVFYSDDGGVTFSGGECLLQFKKIEPLLKKLKKKNVNICIETALNVPTEYVNIALKYVNYYYIDVKILDKAKTNLINLNLQLFQRNVRTILSTNSNVVFRLPLVKEYTYTENNIELLKKFIQDNSIKNIELFKIHNLGEYKYKLLNMPIKIFEEIDDSEIKVLKNQLEKLNVNVKINKI